MILWHFTIIFGLFSQKDKHTTHRIHTSALYNVVPADWENIMLERSQHFNNGWLVSWHDSRLGWERSRVRIFFLLWIDYVNSYQSSIQYAHLQGPPHSFYVSMMIATPPSLPPFHLNVGFSSPFASFTLPHYVYITGDKYTAR